MSCLNVLDRVRRERLIMRIEWSEVKTGEYLTRKGNAASNHYLLLRGKACVDHLDHGSKDLKPRSHASERGAHRETEERTAPPTEERTAPPTEQAMTNWNDEDLLPIGTNIGGAEVLEVRSTAPIRSSTSQILIGPIRLPSWHDTVWCAGPR